MVKKDELLAIAHDEILTRLKSTAASGSATFEKNVQVSSERSKEMHE